MTDQERLSNASLSPETTMLFEALGRIYDASSEFIEYYEKEHCYSNEGLPDKDLNKICEAFEPAIKMIENEIYNRISDFIGLTARLAI